MIYNQLITNGELNISRLILNNYSKTKLTMQETLLLLHLCDGVNKVYIKYNLEYLSNVMSKNVEEVMSLLNDLVTKNAISIKAIKREHGFIEVVDISNLADFLLDHNDDTEVEIYSLCASELGRPLKHNEYEIISKWINVDKYLEEDILVQIKLARAKGIDNLLYVSKVLTSSQVDYNSDVGELDLQYNWLEDE